MAIRSVKGPKEPKAPELPVARTPYAWEPMLKARNGLAELHKRDYGWDDVLAAQYQMLKWQARLAKAEVAAVKAKRHFEELVAAREVLSASRKMLDEDLDDFGRWREPKPEPGA